MTLSHVTFPSSMAAQAQVSATPQAPAPLPQFAWDSLYAVIRDTLWPPISADGGPEEGESARGEPPALLDRIKTLTPDDGWLAHSGKKSDSDAMDVDDTDGEGEGDDPNDGEDVDGGPPGIRYISLKAYPTLAFEKLAQEVDWRGDKATFVIRHEYGLFMEHAMSRLSSPPDDSYRARFFVTGQPGIGKCFGCYYFLFRLLAMGQSVFFLNAPTTVPWPATVKALRNSWVLVDIDEKTDWTPPEIFNRARCVVWTSSPQESRMKKFLKTYGAEKWYMKAWSSKEIAAVTERLAIDQTKIMGRLATGGPVARSLFGGTPVPTPESIEKDIKAALRGNIFAFVPVDASGEGIQPVHRVFLIQPLVVIDKGSERASLQRTDYSAEFLSAHIAHTTFDLAQDHFEKIQGQLAAALDTSTTRSVAGKLVEAMMHRALTRGIRLPAVFGAGTVAGTLKLIGKAGTFVCDTASADIAKRPLYLRPESPNFAAVDAILATDNKLGLIQASLGDSHRRDFGMMLRIMSRLPRGAQVDVSCLGDVIYCLVGTDPERVHKLVAEASRTLGELKMFDAQKLSKELSMRHTKIAHRRLSTFRVVGYTFHHEHGFKEVS
ncbi:hypothetical protein MSAN_02289800 [Mycena sanguinolenta]|uniref:Uncharacterized protein n=1 Tax=Mycena sanguinolenta TaxID=230812 RepID=A0A8H6X9J4_9AGAR|nr:hypothetical protein MSAN_02289800 [Mycena sanguinolenta]